MVLKSTPKDKVSDYGSISTFFVRREILVLKLVDRVQMFILDSLLSFCITGLPAMSGIFIQVSIHR